MKEIILNVEIIAIKKAPIGCIMKCIKEMPNNTDTKVNTLTINKNWKVEETSGNEYWQPQYLYFTNDGEIKEGDWQYTITHGIAQAKNLLWNKQEGAKKIEATTNISLHINCDGHCAKNECVCLLPQIPQSFIESYIKAYNEGNPILTVDVEMEEIFNFTKGDKLEVKNDVYGVKKGDFIIVKDLNYKNDNRLISFIGDKSKMGFHLDHLIYTTTDIIKTNLVNEVIIVEPKTSWFNPPYKKTYTEEEVDAKLTERTNLLVNKAMSFGATLSLKTWVEENL